MIRYFLLSVLTVSVFAQDCSQIPDSEIVDGSQFYLPGPDADPTEIPANWDCTYMLHAPVNLYARVKLSNKLKGVNDYMVVRGIDGDFLQINSRNNATYHFDIIPGSQMSIQVVTRSVRMNSAFSITVGYHTARIGGTVAMKTGGNMNFLDAASMKDSSSAVTTLTYSGTEPLAITLATASADYANIYFIDGTVTNQTKVYDLRKVAEFAIFTRTNFLTIVRMDEKPAQFVLNTVEEVEQFHSYQSAVVTSQKVVHGLNGVNHFNVFTTGMEFVNFDSTGIIMDDLEIKSVIGNCRAYVLSGPPNDSSQLLLNLTSKPTMPYRFNVKYFTVYENDCNLSFSIQSF